MNKSAKELADKNELKFWYSASLLKEMERSVSFEL
jgi:hypothetical protein